MWPLRTFCCIRKVSTTFLKENTKFLKISLGAVEKGMVPRNVTVVEKSTRVNLLYKVLIERITLRNLPDLNVWAGFISVAWLWSVVLDLSCIFADVHYNPQNDNPPSRSHQALSLGATALNKNGSAWISIWSLGGVLSTPRSATHNISHLNCCQLPCMIWWWWCRQCKI